MHGHSVKECGFSVRLAHPLPHRHDEAALGPVNGIGDRQHAPPNLAQMGLPLAAFDHIRSRDPRHVIGDPHIEVGLPGFNTMCHRHAIAIGQQTAQDDIPLLIERGIGGHAPAALSTRLASSQFGQPRAKGLRDSERAQICAMQAGHKGSRC